MEPQTFWLYTLTGVFLVFGVLGLRFALSVLIANALLAVILFLLPGIMHPDVGTALIFGYPLYWGAAFFSLGRLDRLELPAFPLAARFMLGLTAGIVFALLANRAVISHHARLFHATYVAPVENRPALLQETFSRATYGQVCLDSHAVLLRLAIDARDKEVAQVLLDAFTRCYAASVTTVEVVKPLFDDSNMEELAFLMASGLRPSTLIAGTAYRGNALSYAALDAENPALARALARSDPADARALPFLQALVETLAAQGDDETLALLREEGVIAP